MPESSNEILCVKVNVTQSAVLVWCGMFFDIRSE
jgi:hypothetical protein